MRSLLVLTGANAGARGGAVGDSSIAGVPPPLAKGNFLAIPLAKGNFWEAYAPKQCAIMQETGSPKAPYLLT